MVHDPLAAYVALTAGRTRFVRVDELCLRVAESYDHDVRRSLRTLVAVIEPALIILFGLVVGFVALAMLQAIYAVNRSVL